MENEIKEEESQTFLESQTFWFGITRILAFLASNFLAIEVIDAYNQKLSWIEEVVIPLLTTVMIFLGYDPFRIKKISDQISEVKKILDEKTKPSIKKQDIPDVKLVLDKIDDLLKFIDNLLKFIHKLLRYFHFFASLKEKKLIKVKIFVSIIILVISFSYFLLIKFKFCPECPNENNETSNSTHYPIQSSNYSDSILFVHATKEVISNAALQNPDLSKQLVTIRPSTLSKLSDVGFSDGMITMYSFSIKPTKPQGPVWLFLMPEFKEKYIAQYGNNPIDSIRRIQQLMGFSDSKPISYVRKFRVKVEDLIRPSLNFRADLPIDSQFHQKGKSLEIYKFLKGAYFQNNNNEDKGWNAPFTGQGYTYDWCPFNFSHVGVTEFVAPNPNKAEMTDTIKISDFLRKLKNNEPI